MTRAFNTFTERILGTESSSGDFFDFIGNSGKNPNFKSLKKSRGTKYPVTRACMLFAAVLFRVLYSRRAAVLRGVPY
jgi:hypothetical protein